jgi:hypothetical protein
MRIKLIIPFPFDDEGIADRAAQIPREILLARRSRAAVVQPIR